MITENPSCEHAETDQLFKVFCGVIVLNCNRHTNFTGYILALINYEKQFEAFL